MKMRRATSLFCMALFIVSVMALFGCDYARMKDQEAVQTYKQGLPEMPKRTIPVDDGSEVYRVMDPQSITNPLPLTAETVALGKQGYGYFCIMCHGPKADGNGTVGQSFYPLPTNLASAYVQDQSDGQLFYKLSFGYKRSPPLAYTISEQQRWAIIHFLRTLPRS